MSQSKVGVIEKRYRRDVLKKKQKIIKDVRKCQINITFLNSCHRYNVTQNCLQTKRKNIYLPVKSKIEELEQNVKHVQV